jgi:hypothetical protein
LPAEAASNECLDADSISQKAFVMTTLREPFPPFLSYYHCVGELIMDLLSSLLSSRKMYAHEVKFFFLFDLGFTAPVIQLALCIIISAVLNEYS